MDKDKLLISDALKEKERSQRLKYKFDRTKAILKRCPAGDGRVLYMFNYLKLLEKLNKEIQKNKST